MIFSSNTPIQIKLNISPNYKIFREFYPNYFFEKSDRGGPPGQTIQNIFFRDQIFQWLQLEFSGWFFLENLFLRRVRYEFSTCNCVFCEKNAFAVKIIFLSDLKIETSKTSKKCDFLMFLKIFRIFYILGPKTMTTIFNVNLENREH